MSKKHFLRGLRDGIPIGLGYFAVSFGIGISAHNAHLSIFQGFLLSFLRASLVVLAFLTASTVLSV
jgi:predicted branched-subunit amino acid permease